MALSDERLKILIGLHRGYAFEDGFDAESTDTLSALSELLAIRERQASAYAGAAPDAFTDAMERAVLGLPPPAPQRLYSEEELRLTALEKAQQDTAKRMAEVLGDGAQAPKPGQTYLGMKVEADASLPPGTLKLVGQDGKVASLLWTEVPTQEEAEKFLLEAGVDVPKLMADMREHVEKTKARLASERRYSEDEVRKATIAELRSWLNTEGKEEEFTDNVLKRLRGEDPRKPVKVSGELRRLRGEGEAK